MGIILKIVIGLIIALALIVWSAGLVRAYFPSLLNPSAPLGTVRTESFSPSTYPESTGLIANAVSSQEAPITLDGTVVEDSSSGSVNIPYIAYTDAQGRVATKQLVFGKTEGCSPYAGDFPCVNVSQTNAYPEMTNGEPIRVTGTIYEDRFVVSKITYVNK